MAERTAQENERLKRYGFKPENHPNILSADEIIIRRTKLWNDRELDRG